MFVLFTIGAVVMRGAGCTVNDLADRKFDARVARTATRPIASGQISVLKAFVFLALQLLLGLSILLQFNAFTVALGVSSLLLIVLYPFMKRITYWPQLFLGFTFNWGALLGWAAVKGELSAPAFVLYGAGIFWTLGYDTIYAHQDKEDDALMARCGELESAGFPVLRSMTGDTKEVGGEFFRWEFATAVAGVALGINPFDEPDVQRSKDTAALFLEGKNVPGQTALTPCIREGGLSLVGEPMQFQGLAGVAEGLRHLFKTIRQGDYVAILAWLDENEAVRSLLESCRAHIGGALGVPVTLGFGPRYLHSTGQLHKGGSSAGVFLQFTAGGRADVAIPGHDYSFAELHSAQSDADLAVLSDLGRRAARVNLGEDPAQGLIEFVSILEGALAT